MKNLKKSWLKHAHLDENKVVDNLWNDGMPALRIPISGAGRFKGDILAFGHHVIHLRLVRRAEPTKCQKCGGKGKIQIRTWLGKGVYEDGYEECTVCKGIGKLEPVEIVFEKSEIQDVLDLAGKISKLIDPISVLVGYHAHFPSKRIWKTGTIMNWDGKDLVVTM